MPGRSEAAPERPAGCDHLLDEPTEGGDRAHRDAERGDADQQMSPADAPGGRPRAEINTNPVGNDGRECRSRRRRPPRSSRAAPFRLPCADAVRGRHHRAVTERGATRVHRRGSAPRRGGQSRPPTRSHRPGRQPTSCQRPRSRAIAATPPPPVVDQAWRGASGVRAAEGLPGVGIRPAMSDYLRFAAARVRRRGADVSVMASCTVDHCRPHSCRGFSACSNMSICCSNAVSCIWRAPIKALLARSSCKKASRWAVGAGLCSAIDRRYSRTSRAGSVPGRPAVSVHGVVPGAAWVRSDDSRAGRCHAVRR